MIKRLLYAVILIFVTSCSFFETVSKGEKVVQIGSVALYKSDIERILPRGAMGPDSAAFVEQYINSWALKQLMLDLAQKELPKNEKDVSALLNEYKTQLLVFRYENKYVEDRLDTVIATAQKREYYQEHKESFITHSGVLRGRFVKMHNSSPNLQMVKRLCEKRDAQSAEKLERLAYNSAFKYDNYKNIWVDASIVARDMEVDISGLWSEIKRRGYAESRDSSYYNFLQVIEYVLPGEVSPYEYNIERIDEIILSRRKQELVTALHKEVFNEAIKSNTIKFTDEKDN